MKQSMGATATYTWNCLIARESRLRPISAVHLYKSMLTAAVPANTHTFPSVLKACAALGEPSRPLQLHAHLLRLGLLLSHRHATAALLDAYGKCRLPHHALRLFHELPHSSLDAFTWTSLISALSFNHLNHLAFQAFAQAGHEVVECMDAVMLAALVAASDSLPLGRWLHGLAVKHGYESETTLSNALVHAYARLEAVHDAVECFESIPFGSRDVGSWNSLIAGLALNGRHEQALLAFDDMVAAAGVDPNRVTMLSVLKSCGELGCVDTSKRVHGYVTSYHRPQHDDVVLLTALMDMHARCRELDLARGIFNEIEGKNVVCWSAMIAAYEQSSRPDDALQLFDTMLRQGDVQPNEVTLLSVIAACSMVGAARPGGMIHKYIMVTGMNNDVRVSSGLIDMYAKCGEIHLARKLFETMSNADKTVVSWTAMIGAEGLHGEGRRALQCFSEMLNCSLQPNDVTFVALLSACSHSGLVEEGMSCFENMERDHGVSPNTKHYACIVDLLGRAGQLDEAHDIICKSLVKADPAIWGCLLAACRVHGNCKLGEIAENRILEMAPESVGHRVLLANMYGNAGRWDDVIRIRTGLRKGRMSKDAGRSFIEIGNRVHGFTAEDWSHSESELIYEELQNLDARVRDAGYVKELPFVAAGVDHVDAEAVAAMNALTRTEYHSERLAFAFWILMSRRGYVRQSEPVRITKNLRVCKDCHVYTKFVSKVIERELIVRDSHRFHHFKNGICSCGDYW